ncbi:MAG: hypothetical protein COB93_00395 [Sneathiella sp.]|nr:MAG: hypothetical protein COB93_00395 [Sneathiella sp.]
MEFSSEDKIILSHLLKVKSCTLYALHEDYMLSPAQIICSIRNLCAAGILEFDDTAIKLDKDAEKKIFRFRHQIYSRHKPWRLVPDIFKQSYENDKLSYVPKYKKIDKRILKLLDDNG